MQLMLLEIFGFDFMWLLFHILPSLARTIECNIDTRSFTYTNQRQPCLCWCLQGQTHFLEVTTNHLYNCSFDSLQSILSNVEHEWKVHNFNSGWLQIFEHSWHSELLGSKSTTINSRTRVWVQRKRVRQYIDSETMDKTGQTQRHNILTWKTRNREKTTWIHKPEEQKVTSIFGFGLGLG